MGSTVLSTAVGEAADGLGWGAGAVQAAMTIAAPAAVPAIKLFMRAPVRVNGVARACVRRPRRLWHRYRPATGLWTPS
jgi:hypothetical protein